MSTVLDLTRKSLQGDVAFVDVLDPSSKTGRRRVPVKVGVGNGTRLQVLSGVKEGDRVVLPG